MARVGIPAGYVEKLVTTVKLVDKTKRTSSVKLTVNEIVVEFAEKLVTTVGHVPRIT